MPPLYRKLDATQIWPFVGEFHRISAQESSHAVSATLSRPEHTGYSQKQPPSGLSRNHTTLRCPTPLTSWGPKFPVLPLESSPLNLLQSSGTHSQMKVPPVVSSKAGTISPEIGWLSGLLKALISASYRVPGTCLESKLDGCCTVTICAAPGAPQDIFRRSQVLHKFDFGNPTFRR
jgi:hypothetical protein